MSATLEEVVAMLDLPTAEDVADLLRSHGVKGVPKDCARCPIALFAEMMTGRAVIAGNGTISHSPAVAWLRMPPAVKVFIERFDGKYGRRDNHLNDLVAK